MRRVRAGLGLVVLLVGGCGEMPRPFRHDGVNSALAPVAARTVEVRRIDDGGASATALADAVVRRLLAAEIPATARAGLGGGAWVLGVESEERDGQRFLRWSLTRADGSVSAGPVQAVPVAAWRAGGAALTDGLAAELVEAILPALTGPADSSASAPPPITVRLLAPSGLPGDGDRALAAALGRLLGTVAIRVVEGDAPADFIVRGQATVTPEPGEMVVLSLAWAVTRPDGAVLGTATQRGRVPKGALGGAWGGLAAEVAAGGVEGIVQIVTAAERR